MLLPLRKIGVLIPLLLLALAGEALALEPDQLLLLTNKNIPAGVKLAEQYAKVRHVPEGRIVQVSLPPGVEEISFEQYERDIVPPVRRFLEEHGLKNQVTCLVSFYGMPLRIARHVLTPEETKEVTELEGEVPKIRFQIEPVVINLEKLAQKVDATFAPRFWGTGMEDLSRRAARAVQAIQAALPKVTDAKQREEAFKQLLQVVAQLRGTASVTMDMARQQMADPNLKPADRQKWTQLLTFIAGARQQVHELEGQRYDGAARGKLRELVKNNWGLLSYAELVRGQLQYLKSGDTTAAVDNEMALLWWDLYPRAAWQINPMYFSAPPLHAPPVLMVSRLDGPDVATVEEMLAASLRAEQTGLSGRIVVDARGLPPRKDGRPDPYGVFDQYLRNFAKLAQEHSSLPVTYDDKPELLPPHSATDVALYCGWYSVGHYVPCCAFKPGAVGYHVASSEMITLHQTGAPGWVPNLLKAGVAASLGPVAEPYLTAFPRPDEFFPVLMTGKLTLAEAYWRTNPMVSWMIGLVGDPLYNPFAKAPALKVEDLPAGLAAALEMPKREPMPVEMPTTEPTTQAVTGPATMPATQATSAPTTGPAGQ